MEAVCLSNVAHFLYHGATVAILKAAQTSRIHKYVLLLSHAIICNYQITFFNAYKKH